MLIWSANKKISKNLHTEIINRVQVNYKNKKKFYSSYHTLHESNKNFKDILVPYYMNLIEEMMRDLGMFKRTTYTYNLWVQMYNSETTTHDPHEHFSGTTDKSYDYFLGKEIISFNHIIDASNNKCFYFLDDDNNKIYPDHQESGDFFAWPPWRIHGVDKVQEPNVNRLIVAGNIWLDSYVKSPPPDDVYNAMVRTLN